MSDEPVPNTAPKLLADVMLGRLARWLRAAGYDTAYDPAASDQALVRQARLEDRILLTADRSLARSRGARTLLIESDDLLGQLIQVRRALGPPPAACFSRCLACNGPLEPADSASVAAQLPPYIIRKHTVFSRCPLCGRIYWPGTHWDRMRAVLDQVRDG